MIDSKFFLGKTWNQSNVPTTKTLTAIDCLNESICWATGHDAYILKTTDGGKNWSIQFSDEFFDAPLLSISMFNNRMVSRLEHLLNHCEPMMVEPHGRSFL